MSKAEILQAIETDLTNPGSEKSGEYLLDQLTQTALWAVARDRAALVEILEDWLRSSEASRTLWALTLVKRLQLSELKNQVTLLRERVASGEILNPKMLHWFDICLRKLQDGKP